MKLFSPKEKKKKKTVWDTNRSFPFDSSTTNMFVLITVVKYKRQYNISKKAYDYQNWELMTCKISWTSYKGKRV